MARTATSRASRTEGYILLDALISILLSALLAGSLVPALRALALRSAEGLERAEAAVAARNALVMERLDASAP